MEFVQKDSRWRWLVFVIVMALALGWALGTNHVWEDYYITFRSSRNLATGHGLVFNVGDRLHTFTSPLGVLLPAAASWLTGNASDAAAIWLFRVWSAAALAGGLAFTFTLARRGGFSLVAAFAAVAFVAFDGKTLDFTINGMETGFLLLFIAYTLWGLLACRRRRALHLGLAWAALMWTRPDSFLYIALLAIGVFLFNDPAVTGLKRVEWLKTFLAAGLICTALYLPWFLWSWWYYGTPVPHTITAKGNVLAGQRSPLGVVAAAVKMPWTVWRGETSLESAFLPSYFQIGGWPGWLLWLGRGFGLVIALLWLVPRLRLETRVASFGFFGMHAYLTYFPYFPFPWYLPGTMLLASLALGGLVAQLLPVARTSAGRRAGATALGAGLAALFVIELWQSWEMQREMAIEQAYTATPVRRETGLWLKAHAKAGDTVFMEPLGYIGYFSGLKTYDFPGMSSRESVRAIRAVGVNWGYVAEYLCPDWLVLRPWEVIRMRQAIPRLFDETYVPAAEFDNLAELERHHVYGKDYVRHDAHWTIFHRVKPKRVDIDVTDPKTLANFPLPGEAFEGVLFRKLHARGIMSFKVPAGSRHLRIRYGLPAGTYSGSSGSPKTDGAGFEVRLFDGVKSVSLLARSLYPTTVPEDRGIKTLDAELPDQPGLEIVVLSEPLGSDMMDWCCWSVPEFTK